MVFKPKTIAWIKPRDEGVEGDIVDPNIRTIKPIDIFDPRYEELEKRGSIIDTDYPPCVGDKTLAQRASLRVVSLRKFKEGSSQ